MGGILSISQMMWLLKYFLPDKLDYIDYIIAHFPVRFTEGNIAE